MDSSVKARMNYEYSAKKVYAKKVTQPVPVLKQNGSAAEMIRRNKERGKKFNHFHALKLLYIKKYKKFQNF